MSRRNRIKTITTKGESMTMPEIDTTMIAGSEVGQTVSISELVLGAGPRLITCDVSVGEESIKWLEEKRDQVERELTQNKALLFRGFSLDRVERFQRAVRALSSELLDYSERSTPRTAIDAKVFTSTEYPETHEIPMHNENSYSVKWPRRIFFCCLEPASFGGSTPIADSRVVFEQVDPGVRDRFIKKKVMYVRNYGQGVDLSWEEAFQTQDKGRVEDYCRASDITCEWFDQGRCLHTEQVRPAALIHEASGERVWFNQAHLFHVSSLEPALRRSLTGIFSPERLPRTACYGDGTPIEDEALDLIRETYKRVRLTFEWQKGDLLFLDNLFYAHGRLPFRGRRKVIVSMDCIGGAGTRPL